MAKVSDCGLHYGLTQLVELVPPLIDRRIYR